ncbi:tRNA(Ser) Um(44) 2'-O-methyltransferase [Pleurotus pulmonarius]|nr:tRNA(Ser) Um(44) 2'-O-methyltransferase [Pleurotus pulmonarius]
MASNARPRFEPTPCVPEFGPSPLKSGDRTWLPIITCPPGFPLEVFQNSISQMVHHPEYNSTLILRSETVSEVTTDFHARIPVLDGYVAVHSTRRRLLPRRPTRDGELEQHCTLYTEFPLDDTHPPSVVVLTPILEEGSTELPYYHPRVAHIAFRYISSEESTLRIEVLPLPDTPTDVNSRLYRTCLALLDTVHRYGWGAMVNYQKRVIHDNLVPRELYQDLYLKMRERHKHLVETWKEVTDPLKHVFEDIGIATYLMLLWKDSCSQVPAPSTTEHDDRPWLSWPRPSGGFLDLGCGNGLLTHILVSEGYEGHGIDVRARTSWSHYPESTQSHLHVHAIDPLRKDTTQPFFLPGAFLIGNHADELTPWVPLLSTLYAASGYISIPCCAFTFDARFQRSQALPYDIPPLPPNSIEQLNLGGNGNNTSSYSQYRIWLASLSLHCGWEIEFDTLRIPSTRNWALIGRQRSQSGNEALGNVQTILGVVRGRGLFKTREPEGKGGDH